MLKVTLSYLLNRKMRDYGFATKKEFAEYLGICYMHLLRMLDGSWHNLSKDFRKKICEKLDIKASVLDAAIKQSEIWSRGAKRDEQGG